MTTKNKFKDLNKAFFSIYRLHSSKFHANNNENNKSINDKLNEQLNSLKKENKSIEKVNIWNERYSNKMHNSYKNVFEYRKKMAFKFRYMNYSPKKINLKKNFKIKDDKMNKILKLSKSIPNILLKESKSLKKDEISSSTNNIDNKNEDINYYYNKNKDYSFISPFKLRRYIGSLYNYYRSNITLNENNLIFDKNINERNKKNKNEVITFNLNNEEKNNISTIKNFMNNRIINNNGNKSTLNNKSIIKLSSLLL